MSSVTLNCGICFADVKIKDEFMQDNDIYVGPFILFECNHAFCVSCVKTLHNGRIMSINCPMCRVSCRKFRILIFTVNGVFAVEFNINSIKRFSINSCRLNFANLVSGLYPFSIAAETSKSIDDSEPSTSKSIDDSDLFTQRKILQKEFSDIMDKFFDEKDDDSEDNDSEDNDSEMKKIMHLSRLQYEIDSLKKFQIKLLDLLLRMKTQVDTFALNLTNKKLEIENHDNKLKQSIEEYNKQQKLIQERKDYLLSVESNVTLKELQLNNVKETLAQLEKEHEEKRKLYDSREETTDMSLDLFSIKLKRDVLDVKFEHLERKRKILQTSDDDDDGGNDNKKIKL
ncbi:cg30b [Alphabaculovirus alterspexiguae]|uniref:Cg30b n=1 Tax=Spodoptera exigua multiple nucleopolyhedrovirus TaxID=10454 RepID=A0A3G2JU08_9ABAC|nr:cg30b [Spodoptera exigua multiple nucleopolyhedrovirus]AYN45029.1 cg30b [Spodoptera exigua multiple nucleopolyhedrovirus]